MNELSIIQFISSAFADVDVVVASKENGAPEISWGDMFFFYEPNRSRPEEHRFPFATIVTQDYGEFDNASNLNRKGVYRLNIGVGKETFRSVFGAPAETDAKGAAYDFTALDRLLPHPVYGKMYWVCVLNPGAATFEAVRGLLAEAYEAGRRQRARRGEADAAPERRGT